MLIVEHPKFIREVRLTFCLSLIILTLASCITAVQIPFIEPPEIILPPGAQKITFVSRFDTSLVSFESQPLVDVYRESYRSFIRGLKDGFKTNEQLTFSLADTLIYGNWYTNSSPRFDDSLQIPPLITKYQPDFLLTLDALGIKRESDKHLVDYGDGLVMSQTDYFLIGSTALALFDSHGQIVDRMLVEDEVLIERATQEYEYGSITDPLCYDLGFQYALMFDVYQSTQIRYMYSGKLLKEAVSLAQQGQWNEAKEHLIPVTQNKDIKMARRAAQNLGVVEEALGNPAEALEWYKLAQSQQLGY